MQRNEIPKNKQRTTREIAIPELRTHLAAIFVFRKSVLLSVTSAVILRETDRRVLSITLSTTGYLPHLSQPFQLVSNLSQRVVSTSAAEINRILVAATSAGRERERNLPLSFFSTPSSSFSFRAAPPFTSIPFRWERERESSAEGERGI